MIPIIIPTLGRPRVITLEYLTPAVQRHVVLVTNKAQQRDLAKTYPLVTVVVCPNQPEPGQPIDLKVHGIARVRQWIMERYKDQTIFMSDDDLPIYRRKKLGSMKDWHARRATPEEVTEGLERMIELSKKYPMVGMSSKQGNNRYEEPVVFASRMACIWTINCKLAMKLGLSFQAPPMEDFWMHLSFLTEGYETAMITQWMHCQPGSNTKGGCSSFRTWDVQLRAARALSTEWPDFVKLIYKKTVGKNTWFGSDKPRPEVLVQWKRALAYGQTKKNPLL